MINDHNIAQQVSRLMLEYGKKMDASVELVRRNCSVEEFETYRRAVGKIMGYMLLDVMNPLYERHPDIKPVDLA